MSKKIGLILFFLLALTLSACTRSASTAADATSTPKVNFPKPLATSGMSVIEIAGTQTAVATGGLPMPTSAGTTEAGTPGAGTGIAPTYTAIASGTQTTPGSASTALPTTTPNAVVPTASVATPAPQVTSAPVSNPGTYVLHEGENPYCLARRYNVDPQELVSLNGFSANQIFYEGMTIRIPTSSNVFPGPRAKLTHPTQYAVRSGDTIYSVACAFGDVDPLRIASANNLSGSYALTAGATIQIP